MDIQLDTFYTTPHGDFEIRKTRFLYQSYDRDGKAILCGATPSAVMAMTPTHLEAHALGLKEARSYEGVVQGKL